MFFDVLPKAAADSDGAGGRSLDKRISRAGKELALLVQAADPVREAAQDSADATVALAT